MKLEQAAPKALAAFFRLMDGTASYQRAEKALTLHMLEFLAPTFFAQHKLRRKCDQAMETLKRVPSDFGSKVDADEAMARLDALYLRQIRGLTPRPFKAAQVKGAIARARRDNGLLPAWLMGELGLPLGVNGRVELSNRWPFRSERINHLYHLTHLVLLDTAYLMRPVPKLRVDELVELYGAMDWLAGKGLWDLLGECVFCLAKAGTPAPAAVEALLGAQRADGTFAEASTVRRSVAHCTAVGVLALAGALDLERTAP